MRGIFDEVVENDLMMLFFFCIFGHFLKISYMQLQSAFGAEEISFVLKHLNNLADFMDRNSQFASGIMAET